MATPEKSMGKLSKLSKKQHEQRREDNVEMNTEAKQHTDEVLRKLAHALASSEQGHRDRAFKNLKKWLGENCLCRTDMLKVWKGLFYQLWMQDKPLIQEAVIENICGLLRNYSDVQRAVLFIDTFFGSMGKEWNRIDKFRLDKFMLLVRRMVYATLAWLSTRHFPASDVSAVVAALAEGPLRDVPPTSSDVPEGLKLHVIDVFVDELAKFPAEGPRAAELTRAFLQPLVDLFAVTKSPTVRRVLQSRVFEELIMISEVGERTQREVYGEVEDTEAEEVDVEVEQVKEEPRKFKFGYLTLTQQLFDAAARDSTRSKTRAAMYELVRKFQQVCAGAYPLVLDVCEGEGGEGERAAQIALVERGVKEVRALDEGVAGETGRRNRERRLRRERKRKAMEMDRADEVEEEAPVQKLKKRKLAKKSTESATTAKETDGQNAGKLTKKQRRALKKMKKKGAMREPQNARGPSEQLVKNKKHLQMEVTDNTRSFDAQEAQQQTPSRDTSENTNPSAKRKKKKLSKKLLSPEGVSILLQDSRTSVAAARALQKKKKKLQQPQAAAPSPLQVQQEKAVPPSLVLHENTSATPKIEKKKKKMNLKDENIGPTPVMGVKSPFVRVRHAATPNSARPAKVSAKKRGTRARTLSPKARSFKTPVSSGSKRVSFIMSRNEVFRHGDPSPRVSPPPGATPTKGLLKPRKKLLHK